MSKYKVYHKILAVLLPVMLLAAILPGGLAAYARQENTLSVTEDSVTGQCRLRGTFPGKTGDFSVKVYKIGAENKPLYLGFDALGKNGTVSHDFYLPDSATTGTYVVLAAADGMSEAEYASFTHTKSTPKESAALIAPEWGNVLYDGAWSGFSVYCYSEDTEAASYNVTFTENGSVCAAASFTVNSKERTVMPIVLSGLSKGVHTLAYTISKNGAAVESGTVKLAVIEKYNENYRDTDASYGVHIGFSKTKADNEKELEMLHMAAVNKIRNGNILGWSSVESVKGVYNILKDTKLFIDKVEEDNFSLLIGCVFGNALYGENDLAGPVTKEQIDAFCRYVQEVLVKVPNIKTVEIWNEPNLFTQFWGRQDPYAVEYAALVKAAALAIREVRDDVTILGGALSSSVGGGAPYIGRLLDQQIRPYVDGFSFHPYVNQKSADWAYYGDGWAQSFTKLVENTGGWMDSYNSELGYAVGTHTEGYGGRNYIYSVNEEQQAEYLVKLYAYNAQLDVKETFWYNGRNVGTNTGDLEQMYGLMERDFTPRASYAAISQLGCRLNGGRYIGPVSFGSGVEGSLFHVNGELEAVAWVPETKDLSKPEAGCINDSGTASYTFENADFVLRDMYGNVQAHNSTVTFTKRPVYISGLSQSEAAKALAASVSEIGAKYNITSGINTIAAVNFDTATAAEVKAYINSLYQVAVSWINGTGSSFTNRMRQADGFNKTAECVAAFYAYLCDDAPILSDSALRAAQAEALTFTAKMLRKADTYYTRAADIMDGKPAKAQNGFASADMLVSAGLVSMANAVMRQETADASYGVLAYTNPTYPTVARFSTDSFSLTVDNQSGRTLSGTVYLRDANGVIVSPQYPIQLANGESTDKNMMLYTTAMTAIGMNSYTVEMTCGEETFTVKTLWVNITEGSGDAIRFTGFTDADGNAVSVANLPDTVWAHFCIADTEQKEAALIAAVYDGGVLKHIARETVTVSAGSISYSVRVSGITSGTTVKAMAWDSLQTLRPLCPQLVLK